MEYRITDPHDEGFDCEQDAIEALRAYVLSFVDLLDDDSLVDRMLLLANICEQKALMCSVVDPRRSRWYLGTAKGLRVILDIQTVGMNNPKPNALLENQFIYLPRAEGMC